MSSLALQDDLHSLTKLIPELHRFARSLTRSVDAADDLVQRAFERALMHQDSIAAIEEPAGWMRSIIRNLWIDEKRSARGRLSSPLEDDQHIAAEDTERTVIARTTLAKVRLEIANLSEDQRTALMLVCVEGQSYQEAAGHLRIPIGTLMSRLYRARAELARRVGHTTTHLCSLHFLWSFAALI
ncbi:RNA polymerase sigma-70 factor (ECF subfamily) [Skermanella aerolata]|uniref:RNA polymerase sigma factor n=1 Tax=Skermanella aerolata TaxID=393310 RepID=UPI003D23BE2B